MNIEKVTKQNTKCESTIFKIVKGYIADNMNFATDKCNGVKKVQQTFKGNCKILLSWHGNIMDMRESKVDKMQCLFYIYT